MNTAVQDMQPVAELAQQDSQAATWDPYQVWKDQMGNKRQTLDRKTTVTTSPKESWIPYQVWMQHVARSDG